MVRREARVCFPLQRTRIRWYRGLVKAEKSPAMKIAMRNWLVMARKIAEMPETQSSRTIFCAVLGDIEVERRAVEKFVVNRKKISW